MEGLEMGKFENAVGTYMFFEEDLCPQTEDPLLDRLPEKNLKYVSKTRKLLEMKQAYVTAKEAQEIQSQSSDKESDIETISFSNIEDVRAKFKDEFKLPEVQDYKPAVADSGIDPKSD
ncbi:uncharacterized protein LOC128669755 isoform X3 [Plodia interpunctella]|uniref:uncharacterized protein LOC128669755 isoform X3 n=1 Tax=Plodia interpunctella TaxID=58824 RepID=UPI003101B1DA